MSMILTWARMTLFSSHLPLGQNACSLDAAMKFARGKWPPRNGPRGASSDAHSALQTRACGSWLGIARIWLGIPRTEKWPKTGHADDWVYWDWD